jgi:hypothetical protein
MTMLEVCRETGRPLVVRLDDGRTGFYQRRADDCMRAALATLMQVPIWEIPDPRLDERLAAGEDPDDIDRNAGAELEHFLAGYGLKLVKHSHVPLEGDWIGVSRGDGPFGDHTVIMRDDKVAFDPAEGFPTPPGYKVAPVTEVCGGYTLELLKDPE